MVYSCTRKTLSSELRATGWPEQPGYVASILQHVAALIQLGAVGVQSEFHRLVFAARHRGCVAGDSSILILCEGAALEDSDKLQDGHVVCQSQGVAGDGLAFGF